MEERAGLPISPLCDKKQASLPKSQVTFLNIIALPLFQATLIAIPIDNLNVVMESVLKNIKEWQERIDKSALQERK